MWCHTTLVNSSIWFGKDILVCLRYNMVATLAQLMESTEFYACIGIMWWVPEDSLVKSPISQSRKHARLAYKFKFEKPFLSLHATVGMRSFPYQQITRAIQEAGRCYFEIHAF